MPSAKPDAEDALEQATIALFASLGWRTVNAYDETYGPAGTLGRASRSEPLLPRLVSGELDVSELELAGVAEVQDDKVQR